MGRFFLHISYIGTGYHGWQRQDNSDTIQAQIEDALSTILRTERTPITGCGRTDTGVHATQYFAHFDAEIDLKETDYRFKLNGLLSDKIAVHEIIAVTPEAHARFDAKRREYTYRFHMRKQPFSRHWSVQLSKVLDLEKMNQAGEILLNTRDFTSFAKVNSDTKTNLCELSRSEWKKEKDSLIYVIEADRFLRNMVRSIVGTMLEVGQGKMTLDQFSAVIEAKDRRQAGTSAPAVGLSLSRVEYPYLQRP